MVGEDERQEPRAGGGGPRNRVSLRGHRQSAHTGAWSFMRAMEESANETNLTETADAEYSPVWSPNGDKIAFLSTSDYSVHKLCVMNSSGTGLTCFSGTGGSVIRVPTFSPDGLKITFVGQYGKVGEPAQYDIYVRNVDGTGLTRLTLDGSSGDIVTWLGAKHE